MISDGLKKLDDILTYIITNRYLIGRTPEIVPVFAQLRQIHHEYSSGIERTINLYLQVPHSRTFMEEVLYDKRAEMEDFRQKSLELADNLEEDDLIPMAQETVNFLDALQKYLATAGGKFMNYFEKEEDLLEAMLDSSFTLEENYEGKHKTASLKYEFRTETGELIQNDLGYKMFTLLHQVQQDWATLVLAYEHFEFLNKEKR
jgi:hypothetical protein